MGVPISPGFVFFVLFPMCYHSVPIKVPNVFPLGSQNTPQALNVLPNMFPIAPQFLSQIVWP
jgi:hypothetical protein